MSVCIYRYLQWQNPDESWIVKYHRPELSCPKLSVLGSPVIFLVEPWPRNGCSWLFQPNSGMACWIRCKTVGCTESSRFFSSYLCYINLYHICVSLTMLIANIIQRLNAQWVLKIWDSILSMTWWFQPSPGGCRNGCRRAGTYEVRIA